MEMNNSRLVPASREVVWAALNDPAFLKECIAGCENIETIGENQYRIAMVAKVGAIRARFNGKMQLADLVPPESYTLAFEGEGGIAGFAKGSAAVSLTPEEGGTLLTYAVKAQVGGKLAQIGSRLLVSAANKQADEFFSAFAEKIGAAQNAGAAPQ